MIAFVLCVVLAAMSVVGLVRLATGHPAVPSLGSGVPRHHWGRVPLNRLLGAVVGGAAALALTRWPAVAIVTVVVVLAWPHVFGGAAAGRRGLDRLEALAAWTEALRDSASTASGLEQAIPATLPGAPDLLRPELTNLVARLDGRVPLPLALAQFADEVGDPAADMVVAALCLNARQRAGGLTRILSALSESSRKELDLQRLVEHERMALRRQAQRIAGAVIGFAAVQAVFARGWAAPYSTVAGQIVLLVLAGILTSAFVRMRALAEPTPDARFLTNADSVTEVSSYRPAWGQS